MAVSFGKTRYAGLVDHKAAGVFYESYMKDVVQQMATVKAQQMGSGKFNIELGTLITGWGSAFYGKREDIVDIIDEYVSAFFVGMSSNATAHMYNSISLKFWETTEDDLVNQLSKSPIGDWLRGGLSLVGAGPASGAYQVLSQGSALAQTLLENAGDVGEKIKPYIVNAHKPMLVIVRPDQNNNWHKDPPMITWNTKLVTGPEIAQCLRQYYDKPLNYGFFGSRGGYRAEGANLTTQLPP